MCAIVIVMATVMNASSDEDDDHQKDDDDDDDDDVNEDERDMWRCGAGDGDEDDSEVVEQEEGLRINNQTLKEREIGALRASASTREPCGRLLMLAVGCRLL